MQETWIQSQTHKQQQVKTLWRKIHVFLCLLFHCDLFLHLPPLPIPYLWESHWFPVESAVGKSGFSVNHTKHTHTHTLGEKYTVRDPFLPPLWPPFSPPPSLLFWGIWSCSLSITYENTNIHTNTHKRIHTHLHSHTKTRTQTQMHTHLANRHMFRQSLLPLCSSLSKQQLPTT